MAEALLAKYDCNVIATDWSKGSARMYQQAAANTRIVGLEVAQLIKLMVVSGGDAELSTCGNHATFLVFQTQLGASTAHFHIIGHSLASHIAGYAGEHLLKSGVGLLGRITGMDPAEPLFQHMPEFVRLDPGDADFVDVIHSDAKSILMFGKPS